MMNDDGDDDDSNNNYNNNNNDNDNNINNVFWWIYLPVFLYAIAYHFKKIVYVTDIFLRLIDSYVIEPINS